MKYRRESSRIQHLVKDELQSYIAIMNGSLTSNMQSFESLTEVVAISAKYRKYYQDLVDNARHNIDAMKRILLGMKAFDF